MNEEKVKIKITIAGEGIILRVPYTQQEATRRTEEEVNALFNKWRSDFPGKSDRELLAMIAFRYAERYAELRRERREAEEAAEGLKTRLETLVADGAMPA